MLQETAVAGDEEYDLLPEEEGNPFCTATISPDTDLEYQCIATNRYKHQSVTQIPYNVYGSSLMIKHKQTSLLLSLIQRKKWQDCIFSFNCTAFALPEIGTSNVYVKKSRNGDISCKITGSSGGIDLLFKLQVIIYGVLKMHATLIVL